MSFTRLINFDQRILKDFIQIMRLELVSPKVSEPIILFIIDRAFAMVVHCCSVIMENTNGTTNPIHKTNLLVSSSSFSSRFFLSCASVVPLPSMRNDGSIEKDDGITPNFICIPLYLSHLKSYLALNSNSPFIYWSIPGLAIYTTLWMPLKDWIWFIEYALVMVPRDLITFSSRCQIATWSGPFSGVWLSL